MDIDYYITKEDFLSIAPKEEGGTIIGSERFACLGNYEKHASQLEELGKVDKTGEGIIDKVFFFKWFMDPLEDFVNTVLMIISAKIVDRYRTPIEERSKELALLLAKIKLNAKKVQDEQ